MISTLNGWSRSTKAARAVLRRQLLAELERVVGRDRLRAIRSSIAARSSGVSGRGSRKS